MLVTLLVIAVVTVLASVLLYRSCSWLGESSHRLAEYYGMPDVVKGSLLTAVSSSLPEFATAVLALPIHDQEVLEDALGELRPNERAALYLSAVEGYTAREIGELLDMPRGTVLSLMHRGRNRLRRLLEQKEAMP